MKSCLILYLVLISLLVNAQETEFVENIIDTYTAEEYYVLKSDKSIKHGSYVKFWTKYSGTRILESGSYDRGQKTGTWMYFYKAGFRGVHYTRERGQYVNGKKNGLWIQYYMDSVFSIKKKEAFEQQKDSLVIDINQEPRRIQLAGAYLNDKRIGEWTSFDPRGNLIQKYNFSKKALIFDKTVKDTLLYNKNRAASFIGGQSLLIGFLLGEFDPATALILIKDSTTMIISAIINKDGHLDGYKIQKSSKFKGVDNELIRVVNLTDMNWIPATSTTGEPIDSEYKIQAIIVIKKKKPGKQIRISFRSV